MTVVDASVWVSSLVPADRHHAFSRDWLEHQDRSGRFVIGPALLLPELAAAISRRTGRPRFAHEAVRRLLRIAALRLVALDYELATEAARLAADLRLRGADSVYVAVAHRLHLPLLTLDAEQRDRAARVVDVAPVG